jgi:hypothetical protein
MTLGQSHFLVSETSLAGAHYEALAEVNKPPYRVRETPAGWVNSTQGGKLMIMKTRLQNYKPIVDVIPARKRIRHLAR